MLILSGIQPRSEFATKPKVFRLCYLLSSADAGAVRLVLGHLDKVESRKQFSCVQRWSTMAAEPCSSTFCIIWGRWVSMVWRLTSRIVATLGLFSARTLVSSRPSSVFPLRSLSLTFGVEQFSWTHHLREILRRARRRRAESSLAAGSQLSPRVSRLFSLPKRTSDNSGIP